MTLTENKPTTSLGIERRYTVAGKDPYEWYLDDNGDLIQIVWERRDAVIVDWRSGKEGFRQDGVEFPDFFSFNAVNIVTQKYFRGTQGTPGRETSFKQVVGRVVDTYTKWGEDNGYFVNDEERDTFHDELVSVLVRQKASFNSPVWFNIGAKGVPQQVSACFILSVRDEMDSILNWYREEGKIFQGGSGSGVNLSQVRSSYEILNGGGTASGPVSFMRGADASAGTIKSGGKTRRAAKMVILNADHPDVEEFLWCKAKEEGKARVLRDAGYDMDLDGADSFSIQYQNANNSVRVTDEFMQAVIDDADWNLVAVTDGRVIKTLKAHDLWQQIATASWQCADPGLQFDSVINRWHTMPNTDVIRGSNPCSEYMHLDNTSCNLASLNLLTFLRSDKTFDLDGYRHVTRLMFLAQDISICGADFPTEAITINSRNYREIGIGYANLGALLMVLGLPYDSEGGRAWAAVLTALLTGESYALSGEIAGRLTPFVGFEENRDAMLNVLRMHGDAVGQINGALVPEQLLVAAHETWGRAAELGQRNGVRNSQASLLAPTGTIGFMMDCDTTGIEPDLGLIKTKKLVGGGSMSIVNQMVPRALRNLGYSDEEIGYARDGDAASADEKPVRERAGIIGYIDEHKSVLGAPFLQAEHLAIFACSMGDNAIHYEGHVRMMAAVQPFLSGAISKTVNMPEEVTIEDVAGIHMLSWELGLKAVAIYRDNCKVAQPLSVTKTASQEAMADTPADQALVAQLQAEVDGLRAKLGAPVRKKLPRRRQSLTTKFEVAGMEGYFMVGLYEDGQPGELFIDVSKEGSTLSGIINAFAVSISLGLQYQVPLVAFVRKYVGMKFDPRGMTDDPDLRIAESIMDYIFRRLAVDYMTLDARTELSIFTVEERTRQLADDAHAAPAPALQSQATEVAAAPVIRVAGTDANAPLCMQCGDQMVRAGSCHACPSCGATDGCS